MRKQIVKEQKQDIVIVGDYQYSYHDLIGAGNQSKVYKGSHHHKGFQVAVKVIQSSQIQDNLSKALLQNCLSALQTLKQSDNILFLYDIMYSNSQIFVITELCQTDLMSLIHKGLSQEQSWKYLADILKGFSQLYDKGLVHRDLKPDNLFLTQDGIIKIGDMGFTAHRQYVRKQVFFNIGSPVYMAPQTLLRNQYSHESDIWAIGITFYEMITGNMFWSTDLDEDIKSEMNQKYISNRINSTQVSERARKFLSQTLVYNKKYRLKPYRFINYLKNEYQSTQNKTYSQYPQSNKNNDMTFAGKVRENSKSLKQDFEAFTQKQQESKKQKHIFNVLEGLFNGPPSVRRRKIQQHPKNYTQNKDKDNLINQNIEQIGQPTGNKQKVTDLQNIQKQKQFYQHNNQSQEYLKQPKCLILTIFDEISSLIIIATQQINKPASALKIQSNQQFIYMKYHLLKYMDLIYQQVCKNKQKFGQSNLSKLVKYHQQAQQLIKSNYQFTNIPAKYKNTDELKTLNSIYNFINKISMFMRLKNPKKQYLQITKKSLNLFYCILAHFRNEDSHSWQCNLELKEQILKIQFIINQINGTKK